MVGLCEGGNEPPGSLKATRVQTLLEVWVKTTLRHKRLELGLLYALHRVNDNSFFLLEEDSRIYSLDRKRNEEILEQLEVESIEEKINSYKLNWLDHVRRMENSRIPKIMMQYKPRGLRRPGRSLRRLLDGAETGLQRPNS
ncbi:hypothetical protein ANN_14929 [Periplaneta americana]|uniref:Uncharacterized protein n=1 Tax=Periplaneta americana TaxID=6978 RepID=A0ABQ8SZU6_PERAM|nr:hypothetical protein ANN_14929 [Periplaneta americana]